MGLAMNWMAKMLKAGLAAAALSAGLIASSAGVLACACCGTYKVVGVAAHDVLNIRSGPSASYRKVGAIPSGSGCVLKTRICKRRWCKVEFAGVRGWAHTGYLRYFK